MTHNHDVKRTLTSEQRRVKARESLPDELRDEFERLRADYRFRASMRCGSPFVSVDIISDLIRDGWRRVAPPIEEKPISPK